MSGWSRTQLLAHPEWELSESIASALHELLARRLASEPIAYLLGEREFYGRTFRVDRRALIPRPETELLVDIGREATARFRDPVVMDIGTGAGAIAISLALEANVPVVATDVSYAALQLARENAFLHQADVRFVQTDLLNGVNGPLHVVLANLPYVPRGRQLPRDVKAYEPHVALFGGEHGTELIQRLLHEAKPLLAEDAVLAVELDEEAQAGPVAALARELYPHAEVSVCRDAGGYDRVVRVARDS